MLREDSRNLIVFGARPGGFGLTIGMEAERFGWAVEYASSNKPLASRMIRNMRYSEAEQKHIEEKLFHQCDVGNPEQIKDFWAGLIERGERPSGLVYSVAGAHKSLLSESFLDADPVEVMKAFTVNVSGLTNLLRCSRELGVQWGHRPVVLALSFDTSRVYPGYGWMGVYKAALEALIRGLAVEMAPQGIQLHALSAGPVNTMASSQIPHFDLMLKDWEEKAPLGWKNEEVRHAIADLALYLLNAPAGRTGQVHTVDGGYTILGAKPPAEAESDLG